MYWLLGYIGRDGQVDPNATAMWPAVVHYYFKHNITLHSLSLEPQLHIFATVGLYMPHPARQLFGNPVEVWCSSLFEMSGPSQFLPFNRIHSQFVAGHHRYQEEDVLCVCPTSPKHFT